MFACPDLHFKRLIYPWTEISMGNCSYLDTCRNINTCKYVHYELDPEPDAYTPEHVKALEKAKNKIPAYLQALTEPQWIKCDISRSAMGDPSRLALRDNGRRRNETTQHQMSPRRRSNIPLGDWTGNGAWERVSADLGLPESRRAYMGQDKSAPTTYTNWPNWPLAEPFEGALPSWYKRYIAMLAYTREGPS